MSLLIGPTPHLEPSRAARPAAPRARSTSDALVRISKPCPAALLVLLPMLALAPSSPVAASTSAASTSAASTVRAGTNETVDIEGRLQLLDNGKPTRREVQLAVVWYEPEVAVPMPEDDSEYSIAMVRKEFQPRVLAVPVGSQVAFPNNDGILHNAFSRSGRNRFDLDLYRRGESRDVTLSHPGVVQVFCNVHHSMVAHVLVLETPFYAYPDRDGNFELEGLPPGKGHLVLWHERSEELRIPITITADSADDLLEVTLDASKPRVPPHRNKFGKPYQRKRRGKAY